MRQIAFRVQRSVYRVSEAEQATVLRAKRTHHFQADHHRARVCAILDITQTLQPPVVHRVTRRASLVQVQGRWDAPAVFRMQC